MLFEIESKKYRELFKFDPHPFISERFIELNSEKAESVVRLIDDYEKPSIGLIAGVKEGILFSPFSAPFGGFHFRNEALYIDYIDGFLDHLKEYIINHGYIGIELALPPDIYQMNFNAKTINSLIRSGYSLKIPDITNWVSLQSFEGDFSHKNSREYYRQAVRNSLVFSLADGIPDKIAIYDLICENRAKFGRPIFMTFNDLMATADLWPVDFFRVSTKDNSLTASAIFYRFHPEIVYAVFWGDNDNGRPMRAMDFLAYNLWTYYKGIGYKYIDLGISTESGIPNEGLLRFKETHNSVSSLRHKFIWNS